MLSVYRVLSYAVSNEISRFLNENGFGNLDIVCFLILPHQGEEQGEEVDGEPLGYGDGVVGERGAGDGGEWMSCLISLLPTRMMSGCVLIK